MNKNCVEGILTKGFGVASGVSKSKQFPAGTIEIQTPVFKELGLDISKFFSGTLNIDIAPHSWERKVPFKSFKKVLWFDEYPPEDFYFYLCSINYKNAEFKGLIYYPSPETKISQFQTASCLEVLCVKIPDITYGDKLLISCEPEQIIFA
jgi:phage terminase large subunit-like protein